MFRLDATRLRGKEFGAAIRQAQSFQGKQLCKNYSKNFAHMQINVL